MLLGWVACRILVVRRKQLSVTHAFLLVSLNAPPFLTTYLGFVGSEMSYWTMSPGEQGQCRERVRGARGLRVLPGSHTTMCSNTAQFFQLDSLHPSIRFNY